MYCPRCGTHNDDVARFCRSCGFGLGVAAAAPAAEAVPTEFSEIDVVRQDLRDEYEILQELGRGGMAIVFRAREKQLDREVAIKVLPFTLAFDREFIERFQREARTSARLEHPNMPVSALAAARAGEHRYTAEFGLPMRPLKLRLVVERAVSSSASAPWSTPRHRPQPEFATTAPASKYNEAPMLAELVKAGKLPPVEQRVSADPLVVKALE